MNIASSIIDNVETRLLLTPDQKRALAQRAASQLLRTGRVRLRLFPGLKG